MSIKSKYINMFFSNLSKEEKEEIYFEQYIWHAFSYRKAEALEGIKAIEAFENINKNNVYVIFQHKDKIIEKENLTFEEIKDNIRKRNWRADCYIIDKDFKWTFIFTHETLLEIDAKDTFNIDYNPYIIGPFFATPPKNY